MLNEMVIKNKIKKPHYGEIILKLNYTSAVLK